MRDIDSNQKSVKYSFMRAFLPALIILLVMWLWWCLGIVEQQHKEIKIDDDCNMMMVQCIKIQKFHGLQPKNGSLFSFARLSHKTNYWNTHVCLTRQYTIWSDIGRRMSETESESVSVEDRFIKCATYVSDIPFGVEGSCMMMA